MSYIPINTVNQRSLLKLDVGMNTILPRELKGA